MTKDSWKTKIQSLKNELDALYLCSRDPRVPWFAKVFSLFILGYALSPIDLIPDFIPIIGYLDDLILVPFGILLLIKMIPGDILNEYREKVKSQPVDKGTHKLAAIVIVMIWLIIIAVVLMYIMK